MPPKSKVSKKGGAKKKGKRPARKEKKTKFEMELEKYQSNPGKYRELLDSVNLWFDEHAEELIKLLKLHVSYSPDQTSYDDFEAAVVSMSFPFTKLEIRIIMRLFDHDHDGMIRFDDLNTRLSYLSLQDENRAKALSKKEILPAPQWILARFYCLSCLEISEHPYHFSRSISVNMYAESLADIIRDRTGLCTPKIAIFLSSDAEDSTQLQPETMLCDQGLRGGEEWSPMEVGFYYRPLVENQYSCSDIGDFEFVISVHNPILWSKMVIDLEKCKDRLASKTSC
ncbi:hypothetical protein CSKR_101127 [Clonorchis sinensis]|uniref:EF-hand domain-containing protein n=1 Tax=Clonorchis sinensis TaxID=79923 RepID=A0A8T1M3T9_CLOSI|nr:hypothetical protein CSKR_101127 [Clonorchis sinensis]